MIYLRTTIPTFLMDSRALIFGVKEDDFVKERILAYNFDDTRIQECVDAYYGAEKAESDKSKELGEQLEAGEIYDGLIKEAAAIFKKHTAFLKLVLKYNTDKHKKLFLIMNFPTKKMSELLKQMMELYDRVLGDEEIVGKVSKFGFTREHLEEGRNKVVAADEAKRKHWKERGEAQDATLCRDAAFVKLFDLVEELHTVLIYALEDRPQLLEKYGIPVLSPGYKRKKKDEDSDNTGGQNQEEPAEDQAQDLGKKLMVTSSA